MAPRSHWNGYLKLSLVSCPVALSVYDAEVFCPSEDRPHRRDFIQSPVSNLTCWLTGLRS
jgi:hypothetical protein